MALFPEPGDFGGYSGMTTNERLFAAGTLKQFYSAARRNDRAAMIGFLRDVKISGSDAERIADAILADPTKYSY